jgi:hypothetical protein
MPDRMRVLRTQVCDLVTLSGICGKPPQTVHVKQPHHAAFGRHQPRAAHRLQPPRHHLAG